MAETQVQQWSEAMAGRELQAGKNAGAVPARHFHYGRAVVLLMDCGKHDEARRLLHDGLLKTGGYGAQFVAGLRSGVVLLDGARSLRALDEAANVEAWLHERPGGMREEDDERAEV